MRGGTIPNGARNSFYKNHLKGVRPSEGRAASPRLSDFVTGPVRASVGEASGGGRRVGTPRMATIGLAARRGTRRHAVWIEDGVFAQSRDLRTMLSTAGDASGRPEAGRRYWSRPRDESGEGSRRTIRWVSAQGGFSALRPESLGRRLLIVIGMGCSA